MKKSSKRYKEILKTDIKNKKIAAKEALDLVKKNSTTKFDESIDVSLKINLIKYFLMMILVTQLMKMISSTMKINLVD